MSDFKVPPIGTRIQVETRSEYEWRNTYRKPIVGIVAHPNKWDKPGTFRLIGVENADNHLNESVIDTNYVVSLEVLGTSTDHDNPDAANIPNPVRAKSFEIKGSKDNVYTVTLDGDKHSCTCPAGSHGRMCKHVTAARQQSEAFG